LGEEKGHLQSKIEQDVEQQNSDSTSLFSLIRTFFSEIVEEVIDRKALLTNLKLKFLMIQAILPVQIKVILTRNYSVLHLTWRF